MSKKTTAITEDWISKKYYNWLMQLYPDEDETHKNAIDYMNRCGWQYASIRHDKDVNDDGTPKKPHTHFVISFKNQRYRDPIAQDLGIKANYLEPCLHKDESLRYLVHWGWPDKAQYEPDKVCGPMGNLVAALCIDKDSSTEESRVLAILELLDEMPVPCSYRKWLVAICNAGLYGDFRRMGSGYQPLLAEHNKAYYEQMHEKYALEQPTLARPMEETTGEFRSFCQGYAAGVRKE